VRYLGIDPGGRRMGVAAGDDETGVVTPLEVLDYAGVSAAAETISSLARRHDADCIVIGLPTREDGQPTPACRRSEALASRLREAGLTVVLQPEYLSTREARARAREAGLPRQRPVDHLAAQILLEEYLSTL
jgi:putative Holliday junction resolvase